MEEKDIKITEDITPDYIEILKKELSNIRNLIDYYTFENLNYDKKYRMERFKCAIMALMSENEELKKENEELRRGQQALRK